MEIVIILLVLLLLVRHVPAVENEEEGEDNMTLLVTSRRLEKGDMPAPKSALLAWSASLTEDDMSPDWWMKNVAPNPPQIFDHYIQQLSKLFARHGATVNFVSVGACDGTNDHTITNRFFPNKHWQAMFVEPMSNNYRDLVNVLKKNEVFSRSFALRAAATVQCTKPTITVMRPLYEDLGNTKAPHWLRRQIGSIKPGAKTPKDWKDEEVRCVTGFDVLSLWNKATRGMQMDDIQTGYRATDITSKRRRRPHILKVDVEGHDYEVLSSFLTTNMTNELPLLVSFEAKSLKENYPKMVTLLKSKGYVVSPFKSDGFALLTADHVMRKKGERRDGRVKMVTNEGLTRSRFGSVTEKRNGKNKDDWRRNFEKMQE